SRGAFSAAGEVDGDRIEILHAARDAVLGDRSAAEARLSALLAAELIFTGDYDERRGIADEALAIARETGDWRTLLAVLSYRFEAIGVPSTVEERRAQTAEALALADFTDDPTEKVVVARERHTVAWEAGDGVVIDEMKAFWPTLQDQVRRIGQPFLRF